MAPLASTTLRTGGRRCLATTIGALALVVVAAVPASAHNSLVSTAPIADGAVDRTPERVVLTFDEPALALGTQIVVAGPAGPVQVGSPQLVDNTVSQALQPGAPAGSYTVTWRVTSTDGHPISGSYAFTAAAAGAVSTTRAAPTAAPSPTTPDVDPAETPNRTMAALWIALGIALLAAAMLLRWRRRRLEAGADHPTPKE